jgi:pimeloyl-ACP methyl ester carboxylesterase
MTTQVPQIDRATAASPETVTTPNGATLAYETYGSPTGTPLVFFHGMPGSRLLGGLLADRARSWDVQVIAPDRPGCGRSEFPDGFDLGDLPSVIGPLADAVDAERLAVAGFSGGSPYALAAAATCPQRVESVDVVSGSVPSAFVDQRPGIHRALGTLATRTPQLLGACFRVQAAVVRHRSADALVEMYTADGSPVDVSDDAASIVKADFEACFEEGAAGAVFDSRLIADAWSVSVSEIEQPVRLWHGTADDLTAFDATQAMARHLPNASLTAFESHGHLDTLLAAREELIERVAE